jgi:hypothetical protein
MQQQLRENSPLEEPGLAVRLQPSNMYRQLGFASSTATL